MDDTTWFTLPFVDEPLASMTHLGNGKDADLVLEFADGRRKEIGLSYARIHTDHGLVLEVSSVDDATLRTRYTGDGLALRHGRICFPANEKYQAEFIADARAWAESNERELGYVVHAELWLRSTPATPTTGTGDATPAGR